MLTRRARIVTAVCSAIGVLIVAAVTYLRVAAIPVCDVEPSAPASPPTAEFFPRHLSLRLRSLVLRAELDHFVNPLPEIKALHCRRISLQSIVHAESHEQWLVFIPAASDTFILYSYTAEGGLVCKKYEGGI